MSFASKLKRNLKEYKRVISIARKPNREEFVAILKISGLGILLVGVIGFSIQLLYQFVIRAVI